MNKRIKRILIVGIILAVVFITGYFSAVSYVKGTAVVYSSNSILVIQPYKYADLWVFDDPRAGLSREAFISVIPEMIDKLVEDISDADEGFRLIFSAASFPG
mgnify:CR=1 FL=1